MPAVQGERGKVVFKYYYFFKFMFNAEVPHGECDMLFLMPPGDQGDLGFSSPSLAASSPGLLCHRVSVDVVASIIQGGNLTALLHC